MITGKTANTMYWGGVLVLIVCLVGVFILSAMSVDRPPEILMVITTVVGFIFGTHVTPTKTLATEEKKPVLDEEEETV